MVSIAFADMFIWPRLLHRPLPFPPLMCVHAPKDWECVPWWASHATMMVPGVGEGPRLAAEPRASLHLQPVTTQAGTLIPSGRGQLRAWTPQPKQRVQSVFQGTKTIRGFSATDLQPTKHFRRTDLDTTTPCLVNPLSPWISERPDKSAAPFVTLSPHLDQCPARPRHTAHLLYQEEQLLRESLSSFGAPCNFHNYAPSRNSQ